MSQATIFRIYNVAEQYKIIEKVGRGTYGTVYKAKQLKTGELVAIKKIENKDPKAQAEGFPITALRCKRSTNSEINLLRAMQHRNIVRLKEIMMSKPQKRNLYRGSTFLVFEYMDHDFAGLFRHKIRYSIPEVKCIVQQIIEGVKYLHDSKILHRDLKSANLLLNNKGEVKIADFGLGRRSRPDFTYTSKVVTLWYRAPELLLGAKQYSEKIDMWSIGCIMAEFITGEVLFKKDTDFLQIQQIFEICGGLDQNNFNEARAYPGYNDFKPQNPINPKRLTETIRKSAPQTDDVTLDILGKLLELNPKYRINCDEALAHPYFHEAPLPCKPSEVKKLEKEYHEMYREPKPVEKRQEAPGENNKKQLPKAFENERMPPPPQRKQSNLARDRSPERQVEKEAKSPLGPKASEPYDRSKPKQFRDSDPKLDKSRYSDPYQKDNGKSRLPVQPRERERERQKDRGKEQDPPKPRDYRDKNKDYDRVVPLPKDKYDRDSRYERQRHNGGPSRSRSRSRDREREKIREKERIRYQERQRVRDRSRERDPPSRERSREKKYRERSYENNRGPQKPGEKFYQKDTKEYYKQRERDKERERERIEKERYSPRSKDREPYREARDRQGRERERSRDRQRSRDRDRDREREYRDRDRDRDRDRERDRQRGGERGERDRDRDRERDRDRDRERDRLLPMTKEAYQKHDVRAREQGRSRNYPRPPQSRTRDGYWKDRSQPRNSRQKDDYARSALPPPPKQPDSRKQ